ncbi:MAG TPA: transposase [Kiritimatiellia bacterium]|nr:transposase [Kiritimatiellia bacterium]
MTTHAHLRRLDRIWISHPVYFITACSAGRKPILATQQATNTLLREWQAAKERHGWLIGRYVILPEHVHFFCAEQATGAIRPLPRFMNKWKEWTAKGICAKLAVAPPLWQRGFFDHVLRSEESYAEKWAYVRDNPVRAGLVKSWEEWPWQGFVDFDSPR